MPEPRGLTARQRGLKRALDLAVALPALVVSAPVIAVAAVVARWETGQSGIFRQARVGRGGRVFEVRKIRTMRTLPDMRSTVTTEHDVRITRSGAWMRRWKVDELPQLVNVIRGDMSLVGPRPDVPGFADLLEGDDRVILTLRPGITGPATLAFRNEERLLAAVTDPEAHNLDVLWPAKVRLNREYVDAWSLLGDLRYLRDTVPVGDPGKSRRQTRREG